MGLTKIRNPIIFQGNIKDKEYFEGWYYKQISADEKTAISLIPGISLFADDIHSFIQYIYVSLDENNNKITKTGYIKYPLADFAFSDSPFMIRMADNVFTETSVSVKIKDHETNIEGTLRLGPFTQIKKSVLMPNIMGFFAYFPKMECSHGIISMNHMLQGILNINGTKTDFTNGKGYIEKDWGTSFPKKYIWIQCNNFKNGDTSVFCSVADIPFMKRNFSGYICVLVIGKKEYRFATYNNSKMKIEDLSEQKIILSLENRDAKLIIEAELNNTGDLIGPKLGKMQETVKEGLSGSVKISLSDKHNTLIYEDAGNLAGIEISSYVSR